RLTPGRHHSSHHAFDIIRRVKLLRGGVVALAISVWSTLAVGAQIASPQEHFGFRMGADRQLVSADGIEQYFELVASQSDRVQIIDLGSSTEGHRTLAAV